jgi:hypothetical protein
MNRYEEAARVLLAESGCNVRKWRTKNTGTAYTSSNDWGIETPRPRGQASFAVLAHEVGHQLLHRHNGKQRWLEEVEAWEYALGQFDRFGLPGSDRAEVTAERCLAYAVTKALRRRASRATYEAMQKRLAERWPEVATTATLVWVLG